MYYIWLNVLHIPDNDYCKHLIALPAFVQNLRKNPTTLEPFCKLMLIQSDNLNMFWRIVEIRDMNKFNTAKTLESDCFDDLEVSQF